ncbi:MAG: hypothetical protein HN576_12080 [Bacteriovoracaceae bacterium]|nr:hypothetical protein [Bacteriovoracaceae bacterium]
MKLWNNKGFSLISIMMTVGLLGGLSLAVAQVMNNINDGQTRAHSIADEAELHTSIRLILDSPRHCKMSLAGEDPIGSPVNFEKKDIDFAGVEINAGSAFTEASEGLDVDLWYSNVAGDSRTLKKFNGADNPGSDNQSKFGKLNITSIKLVMNNGLGACSDNYCEGTASDTAQLVIIYEKKISSSNVRKMKKFFSVNIGISTDYSGESTILSCSHQGASSSSAGNLSFIAWGSSSCPAGFETLYSAKIFSSGFDMKGNGTGSLICKSGVSRKYLVHDSVAASYEWINAEDCSVCAKSEANHCYTHWGQTSCSAGYSSVFMGKIFQTARSNTGSGGDFICKSGDNRKYLSINTTETAYEWLEPEDCSVLYRLSFCHFL